MGRKRYFSVEEANALVPTLERRFGVILQIRAQLRFTPYPFEDVGQARSCNGMRDRPGRSRIRVRCVRHNPYHPLGMQPR